MSREELKFNIYNMRYWLGHATTILGLLTILWRMAINQGHVEEQLKTLGNIPERMAHVETRVDGLEGRVKTIESYPGVRPNRELWKQQP